MFMNPEILLRIARDQAEERVRRHTAPSNPRVQRTKRNRRARQARDET